MNSRQFFIKLELNFKLLCKKGGSMAMLVSCKTGGTEDGAQPEHTDVLVAQKMPEEEHL